MFERYLAEKNVIGSTMIEASDGGLILAYASCDGEHFIKSFNKFRTISESWIAPVQTITGNSNLLRLKNGKLMMIARKISSDEKIAKFGGANFYTIISDDDGHTFSDSISINRDEECYYLLNNRIIRTRNGRIIIPVCYVPKEYVSEEYFEKYGYSGCFYSDDEGKTWNKSEWLKGESVDQLAEPMVAQGDDDTLHMYMRTGFGYLYQSRSFDNGETWEKEERSQLRSPAAPYCFNYDKYSKSFFAVWDNSFPGSVHQYLRCPICLAQSTDAKNWDMICELDNDPMKSYGYPMIYFTEDDLIITYYENDKREFSSATHKLKLKAIHRKEKILERN